MLQERSRRSTEGRGVCEGGISQKSSLLCRSWKSSTFLAVSTGSPRCCRESLSQRPAENLGLLAPFGSPWPPNSQNWKGQFWEYSMVKVRSFLQKKVNKSGFATFLGKNQGFPVNDALKSAYQTTDSPLRCPADHWPSLCLWCGAAGNAGDAGSREGCWEQPGGNCQGNSQGRMAGKNMWGTWWSTEAFDGVMLSYWWKVEEIMMPISQTKMGISEWLLPNLQPKELGTFSPRWSVDGSQLVDTCNVSHRLGIHCVWPYYTRVSWVKCPGYFPDMTNGLWVWSHWHPLAAIWLMNSGDTPIF